MYIHIIYLCCNVGGCFDDICRAIAPDEDTLRLWVDEERAKFEAEIEKQWSHKVKEVGEDKCRTAELQRMRTFLDNFYVEPPILDPEPWKDTQRMGTPRAPSSSGTGGEFIEHHSGPRGPPRTTKRPPRTPRRPPEGHQEYPSFILLEGP